MSTSKSHRRGYEEKNRRGRLAEKSSSFHAGIPMTMPSHRELRRPKTLPDVLSGRSLSGSSPEVPPRLTKLLLNVTVERSLGAVQAVLSPDSTVEDLIGAALRQYEKEGRRLALPTMDPAGFNLHYSQFSLESLDRNERLISLGSRNFFLCCKKSADDEGSADARETASSSSCSKEADKASKISIPWLKFMDFLL